MENSGIAVQTMISSRISVGLDEKWPSSNAACIITWYSIGKTWSASQGDVHAWRLGGIRFKAPCMFYSHKLPSDGAAEFAVQLIRRGAC